MMRNHNEAGCAYLTAHNIFTQLMEVVVLYCLFVFDAIHNDYLFSKQFGLL